MNTWRGKGGNDIRREKRGGKGYRKEKERGEGRKQVNSSCTVVKEWMHCSLDSGPSPTAPPSQIWHWSSLSIIKQQNMPPQNKPVADQNNYPKICLFSGRIILSDSSRHWGCGVPLGTCCPFVWSPLVRASLNAFQWARHWVWAVISQIHLIFTEIHAPLFLCFSWKWCVDLNSQPLFKDFLTFPWVSTIIWIFEVFLNLCACVHAQVHAHIMLLMPKEGIKSLWAGLIDNCEPPQVGAGS